MAQKLQPWRPAAAFAEIADALNGAVEARNCSVAPAAALPGATARRTLSFPLPSTAASPITVFVDAARGADAADGSLGAPLATVEAALAMVRRARTGALQGSHATIVLREGVYPLAATLQLDAADSHLTLQAYPDEDATISGATPLTVPWTRASPPPRAAYDWRPGTSDAGFNLQTGVQVASLAAAQSACSALAGCAGFSYDSSSPSPSGAFAVDLKSAIFYTRGSKGSVWGEGEAHVGVGRGGRWG